MSDLSQRIPAFQWDYQDRNEWPGWASECDGIEEVAASLIGSAVAGLRILQSGIWTHVPRGSWILASPDGELSVVPDWVARLSYPVDTILSDEAVEAACRAAVEASGRRDPDKIVPMPRGQLGTQPLWKSYERMIRPALAAAAGVARARAGTDGT